MARLLKDPSRFFKKHVGKRRRVLLINPPVQERRYHWIRWNQPTELLKLSSWMKSQLSGVDVRLFDFMFPDERGAVAKHKVKETWTGTADALQLWHFGRRFEDFEGVLNRMLEVEKWVPHVIVISSLTSYWHVSVEKLLTKICQRLGPTYRKRVQLVLYGNYPRLEPEHASRNPDADVALERTVNAGDLCPDFELYLGPEGVLPNFFGLDIEVADVASHIGHCLELKELQHRRQGVASRAPARFAFFNDDVCSSASQLKDIASFVSPRRRQIFVDGICGIRPPTLDRERIELLDECGFRTLFVEHARLKGGGTDLDAYAPLVDFMREDRRARSVGKACTSFSDREKVTAFVNFGLPDDNLDLVVKSTLELNSWFQGIIMKPQGYSPTVDASTIQQRRERWNQPCEGSPQRFPYVGNGSPLSRADYNNLVRWQNLLNKRVKGQTFDFLDRDNTVARLVRETLIAESWKPQAET